MTRTLLVSPPRVWLAWLVPSGVVVFLFVCVGHLGFHPSDDGFLLAQTYRILRGEIPHLDIIFARPMGSALLHTLDFAIPLPLFEASRLTGLSVIVAYSYLFARFTFAKPLLKWGLLHHLGAIGAVMVNLHLNPSMAWHTTDGLLLTALGLVLIQRSLAQTMPRATATGLLALGAAPLMKQSFFLAPLLGVIWVAVAAPSSQRSVSILRSLCWVSLPGALYVGAMAVLGALPDFLGQLLEATPVWGRELVTSIAMPEFAVRVAGFATVMAVYIWSDRHAKAVDAGDRTGMISVLVQPAVMSRVVLTAALVMLPLLNQFWYRGLWGFLMTWILIAYAAIRAVSGRPDLRAPALVAVAWMTCLSWGYPHPNLVAGTLGLHLIFGIWQGLRVGSLALPRWEQVRIASALIATTALCIGLVSSRRQFPYSDLPAPQMTASLVDVSPHFGRIRTNPITAEYLTQLASCVRSFPASRVAVLPDNPGIYPALSLHNPFPTDWMFANEKVGETVGYNSRILESARALDARGGYLILFQTISIWSVPYEGKLEPARLGTAPFSYDESLTAGLLDELSGQRVACGVFVGVYSPEFSDSGKPL